MRELRIFCMLSLACAGCESTITDIPPNQESALAARRSRVESISVMSLGTLGGPPFYGQARDVNELGVVVGGSYTDSTFHAFRWTSGTGMADLGDLGAWYSEAYAVNNVGQIVGESWAAMGAFGPLPAAFLWTHEHGMVSLGSLVGNGTSGARNVNERGDVVGWSQTSSSTQHAFIWSEQRGMRDLGTLEEGRFSVAYAVNDLGEVVGYSTRRNSVESHAFLWTEEGGMRDLGTLGGCCSIAYGINNLGQVVGWSNDASGSDRAFIWSEASGMRDLGVVGAAIAYGINDLGQIVGEHRLIADQATAYFWTEVDALIDLPARGGIYNVALALNGRGQIVGWTDLPEQPYGGQPTLWTVRFAVPTLEEQLDSLRIAVEALVTSQLLSPAQASPLTAKLNAVSKQIQKGDSGSAIRLLDAFIAQVQAFVRAGILPSREADSLLGRAREIQDRLRSS